MTGAAAIVGMLVGVSQGSAQTVSNLRPMDNGRAQVAG
jgi:hypothetical protein